MDVMTTSEIWFYDPEHIGIKFDWMSKLAFDDLKMRKLNETLIFICYVFRQFRNLRGHSALWSLSECLKEIAGKERELVNNLPIHFPHHCISHSANEMGLKGDQYDKKYDAPFIVSEHSGLKGKCFLGKLSWRVVPNGQLPVFILDTKGFGLGMLTGKDMPQYGLDSMLALYAYLLGRYKSTNGYFEDLVPIMQKCISVGLGISGELTMLNQEHIASEIVLPYYKNW